MKPLKTKEEIRADLEREITAYVEDGGVVMDVPRGVSGNDSNRNIFGPYRDNPPRQQRTPLDDVVNTLNSRKQAKTDQLKKRPSRPKRKLITDDFGEPLRWVWVDD